MGSGKRKKQNESVVGAQSISSCKAHLFCGIWTFLPVGLFMFLVADTRLYTLACRSVGWYVTNISEFRAVFALRPLPNRVSGLVGLSVGRSITSCFNSFFSQSKPKVVLSLSNAVSVLG